MRSGAPARYALLASEPPEERVDVESVLGFDSPLPEDPDSEDPEPDDEPESDDEPEPDDEPELDDAASLVFSLGLPFEELERLSVL
jgi:hypothetical protein